MIERELDFNSATRRLLFTKGEEKKIPGSGRSATENAPKHARVKVTINFDGDIIKHFKELGKKEGRSYQMLINDALREYIKGTSAEQITAIVGNMLLNDRSFFDRIIQVLKEGSK